MSQDREIHPVEIAPARPSREEAEDAIRTLLMWAGDDPEREGLRDTAGPRCARLRGLVLWLQG